MTRRKSGLANNANLQTKSCELRHLYARRILEDGSPSAKQSLPAITITDERKF